MSLLQSYQETRLVNNPFSLQGQAATIAHLKACGFDFGSQVWLKVGEKITVLATITDNGFSVQTTAKKGSTRNISPTVITDGYQYIDQLARQKNVGVFFIPNVCEGGIEGKNLVKLQNFCFESDWESLEFQLNTIKTVLGTLRIRPSAIVSSGGKSLHCFIRILGHATTTEYKSIQRKLIALCHGDLQIADKLVQPMRLAGFTRYDKSSQQKLILSSESAYTPQEITTAISNSGLLPYGLSDNRWLKLRSAKYDYDWRQAILLEPEAESIAPTIKTTIPQEKIVEIANGGDFWMTEALTASNKRLINNGLIDGAGRNNNGYALVLNLVATQRFLESIPGLKFIGSAKEYAYKYAAACNPPLELSVIDDWLVRAAAMPGLGTTVSESRIISLISHWNNQESSEYWQEYLPRLHADLNSLEVLEREGHTIIRVNQRYLDLNILGYNFPKFCLKSAMGTGKTTLNKAICNPLLEQGLGFNIVGNRNVIVTQIAADLSIYDTWSKHEKDELGNNKKETSSKEKRQIIWTDKNTPIAVSIESLDKLPVKSFLAVEEVTKVVKALLDSSTCKENRNSLIESFAQHIKESEKAMFSDADIDATTVRYLSNICGEKLPIVINEYKPEKGVKFFGYDGAMTAQETISPHSKNQILADIRNDIRGKKNILIATDSKKEAKAIAELYESEFGNRDNLLLVTSETRISKDKNERERVAKFIAEPAKAILENNYSCVIYTPTCESSLSIDDNGLGDNKITGYFTRVYGLFCGVVTHDVAIQMMFRLRDMDCPRYVFIPPWAFKDDNGLTRHSDPKTVGDRIQRYYSDTVKYFLFGKEADPTDVEFSEKLTAAINPESNLWLNPNIQTLAELKAKENYSKNNLRKLFFESLEDKGHSIEMLDSIEHNSDPLKEIRKEIAITEAFSISTAEEIEYQTAVQTCKDPNSTLKEKEELERAYLEKQFPGFPKTPDNVYFLTGNKQLTRGLELLWVVNNIEQAKETETFYLPKSIQNEVKPWDVKSYASLIDMQEKLDIAGLLNAIETNDKAVLGDEWEGIWHKDHPIVQKIFKALLQWNYQSSSKQSLLNALHISINPKSDPCKILNSILGKFGYITKSKQQGTGDRLRVYSIDTQASFLGSEIRSEIAASIEKRKNHNQETENQEAADDIVHNELVTKQLELDRLELEIDANFKKRCAEMSEKLKADLSSKPPEKLPLEKLLENGNFECNNVRFDEYK